MPRGRQSFASATKPGCAPRCWQCFTFLRAEALDLAPWCRWRPRHSYPRSRSSRGRSVVRGIREGARDRPQGKNRRHNLHRAHDPRPDRGGGLLSALKGKIDDDLLKEAYVEHDGAKQLINNILASGPDDAFSEAKVTVLSEQMSLATAPSRPNAAPSDSWRRLAPRRSRRVRASNAALRLIRSTQNAICWTCCAPATCATA